MEKIGAAIASDQPRPSLNRSDIAGLRARHGLPRQERKIKEELKHKGYKKLLDMAKELNFDEVKDFKPAKSDDAWLTSKYLRKWLFEELTQRRRLGSDTKKQRFSRRLPENPDMLNHLVPDFAERFAALSPIEKKLYELHNRRLAEGRRLTEEDIPRSYMDSAEYVVARRWLLKGDRTPPSLADLMEQIEEAKHRDRQQSRLGR